MNPVKTKSDIDAEIEAIVALRREVTLMEEFEAGIKDNIQQVMEIEGLMEFESASLGLKVRRFQAPTGGVFHRPNFVMNRKKVEDARGRKVDLLPYRLMTTLIKLHSDGVKEVVSANNLSEDDASLFVADHAVREEHLKFY